MKTFDLIRSQRPLERFENLNSSFYPTQHIVQISLHLITAQKCVTWPRTSYTRDRTQPKHSSQTASGSPRDGSDKRVEKLGNYFEKRQYICFCVLFAEYRRIINCPFFNSLHKYKSRMSETSRIHEIKKCVQNFG
jgi:hypothetical protein